MITSFFDIAAVSVLCAPIVLPDGDLLGIIELYRNWREAEYTERDLTTVEVRKDAICKKSNSKFGSHGKTWFRVCR